jgi:hypothetical protein
MMRLHVNRPGLVALIMLFTAAPLFAQPPRPIRYEVSGGVRWLGSATAAPASADETAPDGSTFRLFRSRSSLGPGVGIDARVGVVITPRVQLEGSGSYAKPSLEARITGDVEGIPDVTLKQKLNEWTIEGAVVSPLRRLGFGAAGAVPFVSAGVGYVRHLHEGATLVTTGVTYHVGGGVEYPLLRRNAGRLRTAGLRLDGRAVVRSRKVSADDQSHVAPAFGASMFFRF